MKILFIAPIPPPVTGHSLASKYILEELNKKHEVLTVNLNKNSMSDGIDSIGRILEVLRILLDVFKKKKGTELIYLSISESIAGNLKDIFIYTICFFKLKNLYIHLHGGTIGKKLFEKYFILRVINKFFLKRIGGAIVIGESHKSIFKDMISDEKIFNVPNFAEDFIFINKEEINKKFSNLEKIKVLFISNMIPGKGYIELADGFQLLSRENQNKFELKFAGRFDSEKEKQSFLNKIHNNSNIQYLGEVFGEDKKRVFHEAHVFFLPTGYLEGQPISILEAYASGCVVSVTEMGGIVDIYKNKLNGFTIREKSANAIKDIFEELIAGSRSFISIAKSNREIAESNYRKDNNLKMLIDILLH